MHAAQGGVIGRGTHQLHPDRDMSSGKAAVSSRSSDLARVGFHREENGAGKASPLSILVRVSGAFVRIALAGPKVTDDAKTKPAKRVSMTYGSAWVLVGKFILGLSR